MDGSRIVDVTGALTGRYELLEEREDGTRPLSRHEDRSDQAASWH
jgi:hypothetical protein